MKAYQKYINELSKRFINPEESNKEILVESIRLALEKMPECKNADNAYLGESRSHYNWIQNVDIPEVPKGMKDVIQEIISVLHGQVRWHSFGAMQNITPPVMFDAVVASTVSALYNPNCIWDAVSAGAQSLEIAIVKQIAHILEWNDELCDGIFTFGGKACLTYAIRIGLNRCLPGISGFGLHKSNKHPVVITSEHNHYCIESICSLLGLGSDSCIRINCLDDESIDLKHLYEIINNILSKGIPIACIILSGGNTLSNSMDPVKNVSDMLDSLVVEYSLSYRPFVHHDTVLGWPWLFYRNYNFTKNQLEIDKDVLVQIENSCRLICQCSYADSAGIDFHKTGFSPYITSMYMVKKKSELHSIHAKDSLEIQREVFGHNFRQHHMIEHSRSAAPIMSAWAVLQGAGIIGFQSYIAQMLTVTRALRKLLIKNDFELLNPFSTGFASVFFIKPIGTVKCFDQLLLSDIHMIEIVNRYNHDFVVYTEKRHGISIGFLPAYKKAYNGKECSAIRIFPVSVHLDTESVCRIIQKILSAKKEFKMKVDTINFNVIKSKMPSHVPF